MNPGTTGSTLRKVQRLTWIFAGLVTTGVPTLLLSAQGPAPQAQAAGSAGTGGSGAVFIVVMIVFLLLVVAAPLGVYAYRMISGAAKANQALLVVSTDEEASKLVKTAARRVGYGVLHVYRYEDAIDKLRQAFPISIIIIDDSVPQYEAGLLVAMLNRMPMGVRPLILINDSSELGQTAPSYRAEAVVSRPLTLKTVESAIRKVSERLEQERILGLS